MLQNGRGGQVKFYPYKKGGTNCFSYAEGVGGTNSFEVVLTQELEVLAILIGGRGGGGTKSFHSLKGRGGGEFYLVLSGGTGQTNLALQFSHFEALLPVINDQSLDQSLYFSAITIHKNILILSRIPEGL